MDDHAKPSPERLPDRPCPEHPGRSMSHPLFAYYGEPEWPIRRILVIGYEPGADVCMHARPGPIFPPFNAPAAGKVTFWTRSHLAVSWAAEICGLSIWQKAKLVGSSPIAYSDASPHGARSGGRNAISPPSPDELVAHAQRLLALPETQPGRCPVVILSRSDTGHAESLGPFYEVAEQEFSRRGTRVVVVPFFGSMVKAEQVGKAIAVDRVAQAALHDVVREWGLRERVVERRADGRVVLRGHRPCKLCS